MPYHAPSYVGVLLLDSIGHLIHYNIEAATILAYPLAPQAISLHAALSAIVPITYTTKDSTVTPVVFVSGRRRYVHRVFRLDSKNAHEARFLPGFVVLLERLTTDSLDITPWSEAFRLTTRERETVRLLLKGLSSKEIAHEMQISPNTVKSFLKLVMAKVGVSNRTGIVAKIVEGYPCVHCQTRDAAVGL